MDSANDWVQVGNEDPCIRNEYQKPPDWSMTGSGDEEITRHVICCLLYERGEDDGDILLNGARPRWCT